MALKLRQVIDSRGLPFGTTKTGQDWCVKALHPADPLTAARGVPDHSAVPSVLQNYQATYTIQPTAGCADGWSFEASLIPHPIDFMYWATHDSITANEFGNFLNPQMDGANHMAKYVSLIRLAARWRLAYMSCSLYQDGPDLANQGSIVVCQHAVAPLKARHSQDSAAPTFTNNCSVDIHNYTVEDQPDFDTAQAMPNAYFNRSKEGAYVPLKLTETCQDWVSDSDAVAHCTLTMTPNSAWYQIPTGATVPWPHCTGGLTGLHSLSISPAAQAGDKTSPLLSGTVAQICGRNLSSATRFSIFIRCGIEMQVFPSSMLAPQMSLSPMFDAQALDTYFAICRELKDGYPVDFNDLGKIWDVISDAANTVLPFMKNIPVIGSIANAAQGVVSAGDALRAKRKARKQAKKADQAQKAETRGDTPTLAEIERSRDKPLPNRGTLPKRGKARAIQYRASLK